MVGRGGRDVASPIHDQPGISDNHTTRQTKIFQVAASRKSDGFENFKFAMASSSRTGAVMPSRSDHQPERVQQHCPSSTPALLSIGNITHLTGRSPIDSSDVDASSSASHRSPNSVDQTMDTSHGKSDALPVIFEATEPPTSSPHAQIETSTSLRLAKHMSNRKPMSPLSQTSLSSAALTKQQREVDLSRASAIPSHNASASPTRQPRRPVYAEPAQQVPAGGEPTSVPSPHPMKSFSDLAKTTSIGTNLFTRKQTPLQLPGNRAGTPVSASLAPSRTPEALATPRISNNLHLASVKRALDATASYNGLCATKALTSKASTVSTPQFAQEPLAKKARLSETYNFSLSKSSLQPLTEKQVDPSVANRSTGRLEAPRSSQRDRVPATNSDASKEVTTSPPTRPMVSPAAQNIATSPSLDREASAFPRGESVRPLHSSSKASVHSAAVKTSRLQHVETHASSSPESSLPTPARTVPPEMDPIFMDLIQWYKHSRSTADSIEQLQKKIASKKERLKKQEEELEKLRPLKEDFQALQLESFELRFKKEETESRISILESEVAKGKQALEAEQQAMSKVQAGHKDAMIGLCTHVLKSLSAQALQDEETVTDYSALFLQRLDTNAPIEAVIRLFTDLLIQATSDIGKGKKSLESTVEKLKTRLQEIASELTLLQNDRNHQTEALSQLKEQSTLLERALQASENSLVDAEKRAADLKKEKENLDKTHAESTATIQQLRQQISSEKAAADTREHQLVCAELRTNKELALSQAALNTISLEVSSLRKERDDMQLEARKARSLADSLQGQLNAEKTTCLSNIEELNAQHAQLREEIRKSDREIATLKHENEGLRTQLGTQSAQLEAFKLIEDSSRSGERLNAELLLFLQDLVNQLSGAIHEDEQAILSKGERLAGLTDLKVAIGNLIHKMCSNFRDLEQESARLEQEKKELVRTLSEEREQHKKFEVQTQAQVAEEALVKKQLETALAEQKTATQESQCQLETLRRERGTQERQIGACTAQVELLSGRCAAQDSEIQALRQELQAAQTEAHNAKAQLELRAKDNALELASLRAQLELTLQTESQYLQEMNTASNQRDDLQSRLSHMLQDTDRLQLELQTTRSELVNADALLSAERRSSTEQAEAHKRAIDAISGELETAKLSLQTELAQHATTREALEFGTKMQEDLQQTLANEIATVAALRLEIEAMKATNSAASNHQEKIDQVNKYYRQEISSKDNEIKKLQRKLRDALERQSRLSQQIGQLKGQPTLPQSPASGGPTDAPSSAGQLSNSRSSSLTAMSSSCSQESVSRRETHSAAVNISPTRASDSAIASPSVSLGIPKTLSALAAADSSPESSQSSLDESQIVSKPVRASSVAHDEAACTTAVGSSSPFDEQLETQSKRRTTRRSTSVMPTTSVVESKTEGEDRTFTGNASKRVRKS